MIETIILNLIYLLFPLSLYIIYCMYTSVINNKTNRIIFTFFLVTELYFLIRFGSSDISYLPMALIIIPLLIAYISKSNISIIILNLITLVYYYKFNYGIPNLICLIIDYLLYQLLYIKYKKKKIFILCFTILNTFPILFQFKNLNIELIIYLIECILFPYIIVLALNSLEKIADLHSTIQNIEHEKQVKLSIFKITHEIKNPIAVCKGYLDMFDVSNIEHSEKYIPIIKSEINRTLCLLQDFVDLNKAKLDKEEMDIILLFEDIKSSCIPLLKSNHIQYKDNIDDEEEIYIHGDYNRLKQVLINLIKNSIEALNDNQTPYIWVYYRLKHNYVHIYVEDNGCGMNKETLSRVKEPFFTTKGNNGTGLGVTISNEIIQGHNGIIKYSSREGQGTKVEIILPLDNKR